MTNLPFRAQLGQRLIDGADESTSLNSATVSDGMLDVNNALLARAGTDVPDTAPPDTPGRIIFPPGFSPFSTTAVDESSWIA